jgi:carboxypeptidase C (cathepsin A)
MLKFAAFGLVALAASAVALGADEPPKADAGITPAQVSQLCKIDIRGDKKEQWMLLPKAESSVTQHRIVIAGKPLEYTATAGTLIVRDDDDKPIASMGYVAYTRPGLKGAARPVTFAFNGGPGSSSLWLHMGVLGPKRVVVKDPDPTPAGPYRTVDNEYGLIDKSDLVMIDPVGTGIAQYVSDNGRWSSPKYLLGESYGTTRGAAILNYLRSRRDMDFNGLILVSVATDIEAIFAELPGNDRPYAVYLPAFAAVAWYHHQVPNQPAALEPYLQEVRAYAEGPYSAALQKGDALPEAELEAAAQKMHDYTGLPVDYLKAANLRLTENAFAHELLKSKRQTVGRLDGRYVGVTWDPLQKETDYDPQSAAISAAFAATFLDYYHEELKFGQGVSYRPTFFTIGDKWRWTHKTALGDQFTVNTGVDLAEALIKDPSLKVLVLSGYYDLATPFSATEYVMKHLGVPPAVSARVSMKYYEAGHMMYVHPPSAAKMKRDIDAFIDATAHE